MKLGFADVEGSWDDARRALGEMTGLGPNAEVFKAKKPRGFFEYLEEASTEVRLKRVAEQLLQTQLSGVPLFMLPGAIRL
ncbi:MAG: hypothetical protein HC902_15075 [Calothrix sp. SM1_5_4]|nr:hypothetical protein [Calothrix sp. SM1_5_4]